MPQYRIPVGELRNRCLQEATGEFITNWDDEDLSHPQRLDIQMAALWIYRADACLLHCQYLWYPQQKRLAVSNLRWWENSSVLRKACVPLYASDVPRGEDTAVIEQIVQGHRTVLLRAPHIYINLAHGANSFDDAHWNQHWRCAQVKYKGEYYTVQLAELARQISFDLFSYEQDFALGPPEALPASLPTLISEPVTAEVSPGGKNGKSVKPSVLIIVLLPDAAQNLDRLWG